MGVISLRLKDRDLERLDELSKALHKDKSTMAREHSICKLSRRCRRIAFNPSELSCSDRPSRGLASGLVGRIMLGVKRDQPQEITLPECQCADSLAEPQGIHLRPMGRREVLNSLPVKALMPIESVPVELAQTVERGSELFQFGRLQPEKDLLKCRAIKVQANAIRPGHAGASLSLVPASAGHRGPSPAASFPRPRPILAGCGNGGAPGVSKAGFPAPSSPP